MSTSEATLPSRAASRVAEYVDVFMNEPLAFRGQQLRGTGPIHEFEGLLAKRCGFPFCVSTCNATTALLVVAIAAKLRGREVICPPNNWAATFGLLEFAGAKLIRAEADELRNICPRSVESLMSAATAAVLAADWKGERHQVEMIAVACRHNGCLYIEDTSYIPPERSESDRASVADVQVISFGPGKPLSLGEGGAILTRSSAIYETAVALSQHPERCRAEGIKPMSGHQFLNARMHPLAAILGVELLKQQANSPSRFV
ncbi:MAG TPA: DegT/DnrJ/EryC1/StrS family aminotransferase [Chthoniobacterales bacterium]|nr:DegT/DnrJ/EryC1/StrS family aminotransferase [Chthoniobacterales bacterium]